MFAASQDLVDLARDFLVAFTNRDADLVEQISVSDGVTPIFSFAIPPGFHDERDAFLARLRERPRVAGDLESSPVGAVQGDVAWLVDEPRFPLPDDRVMEGRWTVILNRIEGDWKVVHSHLSLGVNPLG